MKRADLIALLLMFTGVVILLLRPQLEPRSVSSANPLLLSPVEEGECPYCDWRSMAEGITNRRRSLSAHVRQQHPRQWASLNSYKRD